MASASDALAFQFDTSGMVYPMEPRVAVPGGMANAVKWPDLSPFVQGYVAGVIEAINFDIVQIALSVGAQEEPQPYGFFDLASETLAQIMEDCDSVRRISIYYEIEDGAQDRGREFWEARRAGNYESFPPLTPYLGEDGRVYLRERAF